MGSAFQPRLPLLQHMELVSLFESMFEKYGPKYAGGYGETAGELVFSAHCAHSCGKKAACCTLIKKGKVKANHAQHV